MLSKRQYQILNVCADDWELFYFPFAELNYGSQVSGGESEPGGTQHENERSLSISTPASPVHPTGTMPETPAAI